MENAADALKMIAAFLMFLMALSISIMAFGRVRETSQIILEYEDREYDYTYVENNYDNNGNVVTQRWVGVEEIIPSIYKAYYENNKILFDIEGVYLFKKEITQGPNKGTMENINYIDLDTEELGLDSKTKREFLKAILYWGTEKTNDEFKHTLKTKHIELAQKGLYQTLTETLKNKKLKESIGVYYMDEVKSNDTDIYTPKSNRDLKRIITYSNK